MMMMMMMIVIIFTIVASDDKTEVLVVEVAMGWAATKLIVVRTNDGVGVSKTLLVVEREVKGGRDE